jgi:ABC-2 type transport system ATP-binding protein
MRPRLVTAAASAAAISAALISPIVSHAAGTVATTNGCVTSVPEPGSTTPVQICYTLFQPPTASAAHKTPLIFHSHGWGGSRTTDPTSSEVKPYLDAGYGVLSFDQRGFGQSNGSKAYVENPDLEGRDVEKLVDLVSHLSWVVQDGPGDPRIGAVGGSYGGGYQFVGAFREIADTGKQIFDALAPQITWWDLKQSLAPQGVAKTEWDTALTAAGAQALPNDVLEGFAESAATGTWTDGSIPGTVNLDAFFAKNGPSWQVSQGRHIDVPVLFGQGITDELFPLDQGLKNWANALTADARAKSIFVGYNGGHTLPSAYPAGVGTAADPCSKQLGGGTFEDLSLQFMQHYLQGVDTPGLYDAMGLLHLSTAAGDRCVTLSSPNANTDVPVAQVLTNTGAGAPQVTKLLDGPLTVAGTPTLDGTLTTVGLNNRAFFALAVGTSVADAKIVQNNVRPLNEPDIVSGAATHVELPSVAIDVPAGQSLFLLVSPTSDMFFGHGSRTPGLVELDNVTVHVPVVYGQVGGLPHTG